MKKNKKIIFSHYSYFWNFILFLIDLLPPLIRNLLFSFLFKNYGKSTFLDYKTYWRYPSKISIGNYTTINRGSQLYPSYFIKDANIIIGDHVVFAPNVVLFSASHNYSELYLPNIAKSIVIENNVWIGGNTLILPGVKVGEGAIIGAGSVVCRDIPPWCLAVGNPARVIKKRQIDEAKSYIEEENTNEYSF